MKNHQESERSQSQYINVNQANETLKLLDIVDPVRGEKSPEDDRLPYRHPNVLLIVAHPGGGIAKYFSYTRYLSATRLSVITKVFVHAGCKLRVYMPDNLGMPVEQEGTVIRCNYVSNSMHEVLIMPKERVNLRQFLEVPAHFTIVADSDLDPEQLSCRALLFSDNQADVRLIKHFLRKTKVHLADAHSMGEALDMIRSEPFDAVVCGDIVQGLKADRVYASLRDAGYSGAFAALCPAEGASFGISDDLPPITFLSKPLDEFGVINGFSEMISDNAGGASGQLYSTLPKEEQNSELVEWYIGHVKCVVHALQKAVAADMVDDVRRYISTLRDTASSYGFASISEHAASLLKEINASGSIAESNQSVQKCIHMTRQMRAM